MGVSVLLLDHCTTFMQTERKHETYPLTWKQMVTSPFIVMCSFIFTQNSHIYNFTNVNRGSFTAVSAVFILHQAALWQRCWTEGQHSGFFLSKRWKYLLETQNHSLLEHKNTHHSLLTIWADTEQCCWRLPDYQLISCPFLLAKQHAGTKQCCVFHQWQYPQIPSTCLVYTTATPPSILGEAACCIQTSSDFFMTSVISSVKSITD